MTSDRDIVALPREPEDELARELVRVRRWLAPAPDPDIGDRGTTLPALVALAQTFTLAAFERELIALALAADVDASCARHVAELHGDPARARLTIGLAVEIVHRVMDVARGEIVAALAPSGHLAGLALVELDGSGPVHARTVRVPDTVWPRLVGMAVTPPFADAPPPPGGLGELTLAPRTRADATLALTRLGRQLGNAAAVVVRGRAGTGRDAVAAALAGAMGFPGLVADLATLDTEAGLRTLVRETGWRGATAIIKASQSPSAALVARLARDLSTPLVFVVDEHATVPGLAALRTTCEVVVEPLDLDQRERRWQRALATVIGGDGVEIAQLLGRFTIGPGSVGEAVALATAAAAQRGATLGTGDVIAACRRLAPADAGSLARRLECRFGWDDLILPPAAARELAMIETWSRHAATTFRPGRAGGQLGGGAGLVCLFAGPPGTGKTMAAQVLAGSLGLELLRIDLSQVVDKYIGETEKHLERVFTAAEHAGAVLFFDEADALFGKRAEVKDARDRYANLEVAFLLQRLEDHRGLVILASNLRKHLDDAFLRRIQVIAEFPVPEAPERLRLWRRQIAPPHLAPGVDFGFFAQRFTVAGGDIKNAATTAVLLAARDGGLVTADHLAIGLWRELGKSGRIVSPEDFGPMRGAVTAYLRG